jgi:Transglutaminase-like superfamily
MKTWRGFRRMSGYSRSVALEAAAGMAATYAGLRLAGFRRWKNALSWSVPRIDAPANLYDPTLIENARQIAHIQQAVSRHLIFHANCLEQSLVLRWLLGRRGIPGDLRIGARKRAERFEAHAWVELGGVVLNDPGEDHLHFSRFDGSIVAMETQIR